MEICGGHTHTIYRHGIKDLLPQQIELVHGPGCPVCVLPMGRMDDGIAIAERPEVIFTCFGDMMRVPGSKGSLLEVKARGADIRMVYSPLDALRLARRIPTASRLLRHRLRDDRSLDRTHPDAGEKGGSPQLLRLLQPRYHRPPVRALLDSPDLRLDAFHRARTRLHGHRLPSLRIYHQDYGKPVAVAGFEPLDLLQSILMLMRQLAEGRCEVENQYTRSVPWEGNLQALKCMAQVFELRPYFEWRGLGFIAQSALRLSRSLRRFRRRSPLGSPGVRVADPKACQCGEVLKGVLKPWAVQSLRHRLHAGTAARRADGLVRGRLRRLLQLRPQGAGARNCAVEGEGRGMSEAQAARTT